MAERVLVNLGGVAETMLIPVYFRAIASKMKKPALMDTKAIELVDKIDYDFSKFSDSYRMRDANNLTRAYILYINKMTRMGITTRTIYLDRETNEFIKENPHCNCINIGCGLDTRFFRVDNGKIGWYDVDLTSVIDVREKLIAKEDRVITIKGSAFEKDWTNKIVQPNLPTLIIIEGMLMYFDEEDVKKLLDIIAKAFPHCTILLEASSPLTVKNSNKRPTVLKTSAVFKWGIKSGKEIEVLCPALEFKNEWNFSEGMKKLSPIFITLMYPLLMKVNNSIVKLVSKA